MNKRFNSIVKKFDEIHHLGWIKSINNYQNGAGLTFENLLDKKEDNFSYPDFDGVEIKTQKINSKYTISLFNLTPWGTEYPEIERIRKKYGYYDYDKDDYKKINIELYASKNILSCNRFFFNLEVNRKEERIYLIIQDINYNILEKESYWSFEDIKERLYQKLKYLGFIHVVSIKKQKKEYYKYIRLECYILKDFENFLNLIEKNIVSICFTTTPIKYGPRLGKNQSHCIFKINKFDLNKMFTLDHIQDYNSSNHY